MITTIAQHDLATALSIAGKATNARSTMPILGCVLLTATDNGLRVEATNREWWQSVSIPANVARTGSIAVTAKQFAEYVNTLPPGPVTLTLDKTTLHLESESGKAKFPVLDADDFPLIASENGVEGAQSVGTDVLRGLVQRTAFSASTDDSKPTLTCVEIALADGCLKMAATDGYRLSVAESPTDLPGEWTMLIPARMLAEVRTASKGSETIEVGRSPQNWARFLYWPFSSRRIETIVNTIDAKFPDYATIIPKASAIVVDIDSADLRASVDRAMVFARDNSNIVELAVSHESIRVSGRGQESGDSASTVRLVQTVKSGEVEIAFNGRFLLEMLAVADAPVVRLALTQPTRPALWTVPDEDGWLHVIMPMHPPGDRS